LILQASSYSFIIPAEKTEMKVAQKLVTGYFRAKLQLLSVFSARQAARAAFDLFCTPLKRAGRVAPPVFEKGEPLKFQLGENQVVGHRWNAGGKRKLLIVHGFQSCSGNFSQYITALTGKGYEVLAFDAPAHGMSGGRRINLPLYIAMLDHIHKAYGPVDDFLAHSYGCVAVSHFLETIPHDASTKAVFIAPATETTSTVDSFFTYLRLNDHVRKEFDQVIYELGGHWPAHFSVRRALQHSRANVLWFHDEDDDLTPVEDALRARADNLPNVSFHITRGLGHRRIYRDSGIMQEVIDFFEEGR